MKKLVAWIKVYGSSGEYRASCVWTDDAAILCAALGKGTTARNGHTEKRTIWREGYESFSAAESYDLAARKMNQRVCSHIGAVDGLCMKCGADQVTP